MRKNLVIATRGSQLALWQAGHVKACLESLEPGLNISLRVIKTRGDIILDVPLSKVGGKGLFVKEIEEALLDGSADLAVHSIKDVPMILPDGLVLGCVPRREICVDYLLSSRYGTLDELPRGARVGTSSLRRQAQLLNLRPDLEILSLRGNVDTRLRKMKEGEYDAIVLASAGLKRLGLSADRMQHFEAAVFVPAVGQGALGIECRGDDSDVLELLSRMEHRPTRVCVEAERGFLAAMRRCWTTTASSWTAWWPKWTAVSSCVNSRKVRPPRHAKRALPWPAIFWTRAARTFLTACMLKTGSNDAQDPSSAHIAAARDVRPRTHPLAGQPGDPLAPQRGGQPQRFPAPCHAGAGHGPEHQGLRLQCLCLR